MALIKVPNRLPHNPICRQCRDVGDTIQIEAGFASAAPALITSNNLTIDGLASINGIVLTLDTGISQLTITGRQALK